MNSATLPEFVNEGIEKICRMTETSKDEVRSDYLELFNDPFIQNDPQFTTNSQRYIFALKVLISRTRPGKLSTEDPRGG